MSVKQVNYIVLSKNKIGELFRASSKTLEHAVVLGKHFSHKNGGKEYIYKLVAVVDGENVEEADV